MTTQEILDLIAVSGRDFQTLSDILLSDHPSHVICHSELRHSYLKNSCSTYFFSKIVQHQSDGSSKNIPSNYYRVSNEDTEAISKFVITIAIIYDKDGNVLWQTDEITDSNGTIYEIRNRHAYVKR